MSSLLNSLGYLPHFMSICCWPQLPMDLLCSAYLLLTHLGPDHSLFPPICFLMWPWLVSRPWLPHRLLLVWLHGCRLQLPPWQPFKLACYFGGGSTLPDAGLICILLSTVTTLKFCTDIHLQSFTGLGFQFGHSLSIIQRCMDQGIKRALSSPGTG